MIDKPITIREWIENNLDFKTTKELVSYDHYNVFKEETGSSCSFKTYKNSVYKYNKTYDAKSNPKKPSNATLTKKEEGNEVTVVSRSEDIRTLDDLIKASDIDLDIWKVTSWKSNKWSTPVKIGNQISQVDNYQVKASLSKHVLSPTEFEPLKPITIQTQPIETVDGGDVSFNTALIISDSQIGFIRDLQTDKLKPMHDRNALSLALQVAETAQPTQIILNGDMLDLSDWSDKFVQSSEFAFLLQKSVIELGWWIAQFHNAVPNAKISYILGNHEERLDRAIIRNLPLAYGLKSIDNLAGDSLLSIQNMIKFNDFEINWSKQYPYGEIWLNKRTRISHGKVIAQGSGATTQKISKLSNNNEIVGHIHRIESALKTVYDHEGSYDVGAYSFGCLCKIDESVPSNVPNLNWQQGFGIVEYDKDTEHILTFHIKDNKVSYKDLIITPIEDINKLILNDTGV